MYIIRGTYIGYFDSDIKHYLEEYYGPNLHRLKAIKDKQDPEHKFKYHQSL